jgi:hypothetical protein
VLFKYDDDREELLEARRIIATLRTLRSCYEIAHSKMYLSDK